jgi:hypothetical protein
MTMPYPVPNEKDWQALRPQQVITATVEVQAEGGYALSEVQNGNQPEAAGKKAALGRPTRP